MILNSRISLFNEEAKKKKKGSTDHDFDWFFSRKWANSAHFS